MDEFLEHGERIAKASPRRGWGAVQLAQHLHENGQNDRSLEMWDRALEDIPTSSKYRYTHFNLAKAELLIKMDRHADARSIVEGLDPKRTHSGAKERIEKVTRAAKEE